MDIPRGMGVIILPSTKSYIYLNTQAAVCPHIIQKNNNNKKDFFLYFTMLNSILL